MKTHSLRSLFSRRNAAPFIIIFLLAGIVVCGFTVSTGQSSAEASVGNGRGNQKPPFTSPEDLAKEFNDDDLKVKGDQPGGKWRYSTLLDSKMNDSLVPAYVSGIQLLSGARKHAGVTKLKRVQIKNRSSQTIVSVQVRVEVVYFDEPEKILLEDTFPLVNVSIAPDAYQLVEIQTLYPAKMLKALAKEGNLYGHFGIRMGVQEVRFADGSFWRRPESLALLKSPYLEQSLDFGFPDLASLATYIRPPIRGSDIKWADMTQCMLEPGLAAPAFTFVPFQTTTCHDNAGPSVEMDGRKSCGAQGTSTCYQTCSDDGWCETAQSLFPCSVPTPTPTPTPPSCTGPPPAPCCTPEIITLPGTQIQRCRWNCQPPDCSAGTVFADGCVSVSGPTACGEINEDYTFTTRDGYGGLCCPPAPTPTPTPETASACPCGVNWMESCFMQQGYMWNTDTCCCEKIVMFHTPVVVDVLGDGFRLTDAAGGVLFDFDGDGAKERLSWTAAGADDSWLVLDRDGNGTVDDGRELFGNLTPQPFSSERNGFRALAVFDSNADGRLDAGDAVFPALRLWRDGNHDGVSQPGELYTLPALDVTRIHLSYKESKREDEFGNRFRYRAKVDDAQGAKVGRWAWDVFLLRAP